MMNFVQLKWKTGSMVQAFALPNYVTE